MVLRTSGGLLRWTIFVVLLALTIAWLIGGHPLAQRLAVPDTGSSKSTLDDIASRLEREDPEAASQLARLREDRRVRELALASAISATEERGGLPCVKAMLVQAQDDRSLPAEVRLSSLASDPRLLPTGEARGEFLHAHGTVVEVLHQAGTPHLVDQYLDKLEGICPF